MSIASLFESGERSQDKGHFRNMVLIARADGVMDEAERKLLDRIGSRIGLTKEQIQDIIRNPEKYSYTPPNDRDERYEQIVNLIQMAQSDGSISDPEKKVIERVMIEIGFNSIDDLDIESIVAMVVRGEDTDVIIDSLL